MMFNDTTAATVALYTALHEAIFNDAALDVIYATGGDITRSRTIHPLDIAVGTKGSDIVWAFDDARQKIISLRIDRFVSWGKDVMRSTRW